MVNILERVSQRQVTASHPELPNLSPSRLHIRDLPLDHYPPRHMLESLPVATAIQNARTVISNTTFDTLRANDGQSGSSQFFRGEIEQRRPQRNLSILSPLAVPSRAPAELMCLLGDKDGKLKPGVTVRLRGQGSPSREAGDSTTSVNATTLERAKPRPRVGLNLRLDGDTFVQGQTISGQLIVHVGNAEVPVRMANSKLRVLGLESLTDSSTFHVFFHYSCWIDEISYASEQVFSESPDYVDEEGYREAREGMHVLPFEMTLPTDSCFGKPKGDVEIHGAAVRYVIMASVNIKDPDTNQVSLAHFYRACSIWPSLSIHDVLVPSTRPLVSTAAMALLWRGLRRKLKLSTRVSRPSYFSGQLCCVHIQVSNDTHKTVRSLRLALLRTTTMYRPRSGKGNRKDEHDNISSSYQTKRFVDEVSERRLTMAEPTTRGCASSRGWWAGVSPQERTAFTHSILIPPNALSIARTELLAVDYAVQTTIYISTGTLGLNSHLSVTLPIRIVSMLSVDPPTSVSPLLNTQTITHSNMSYVVNGLGLHLRYGGSGNQPDSPPPYRTRTPSLEHPQDIPVDDGDIRRQQNEILPHYQPTPNPLSAASLEESIMREHAFDETSSVIDQSPLWAATTQDQQPPARTIEAQFPRMDVEKQSRQCRTARRTGLLIYKEEETRSPDTQTSGDRVSQSSMTAALSNSRSPRNIVSPISSLYRARARALTITSTSVHSQEEQTELRGGFRGHSVQSSNEDDTCDFRSSESPFSRRVKEKLRQIPARGKGPHEPSQQNAEPPASVNVAKRDGESKVLAPLSHLESSGVRDSPTPYAHHSDGDRSARRTKPLYVGTANKPKLLMGPRRPNTATAQGSVMDRVRMIEGRDLTE